MPVLPVRTVMLNTFVSHSSRCKGDVVGGGNMWVVLQMDQLVLRPQRSLLSRRCKTYHICNLSVLTGDGTCQTSKPALGLAMAEEQVEVLVTQRSTLPYTVTGTYTGHMSSVVAVGNVTGAGYHKVAGNRSAATGARTSL